MGRGGRVVLFVVGVLVSGVSLGLALETIGNGPADPAGSGLPPKGDLSTSPPTSIASPTTTTTAPTTTTSLPSVPASVPPGSPGEHCGAVARADGGIIQVSTITADVGCAEALEVIEIYASGDLTYEGSSAFATIDRWTCWSDTAATPDGVTGGCSTDGASQDGIEMRS